MFYTYKVFGFDGKIYYQESKESLFKIIDDFGLRSFLHHFCNTFEIGEGHIQHSFKMIAVSGWFDKCDNYKFYANFRESYIYRNGNYRIESYGGATVDIDTLVYEYQQSRNLLKVKNPKHVYNSWAKQKSRPLAVKYHSGVRQERIQNVFDKMDGYVKLRTSRVNAIKHDYYFESHQIKGKANSWKNSKKQKQWM